MPDKNSVYDRDADNNLAIRTLAATGDAASGNKNDVYARDKDGNLCLRVINAGGGSGGTSAANVSFDPANLKVLTGNNVQSALTEADSALAHLQDSASILQTTVPLANTIGADTVIMLDELTALEIDGRPNYKEPGATVYAPKGQQGIIHSVDTENQSAIIKTTVLTAASAGVAHNSTMTGDGTPESPLGVSDEIARVADLPVGLPASPTDAGTYILQAVVDNGVTTIKWVPMPVSYATTLEIENIMRGTDETVEHSTTVASDDISEFLNGTQN